MDQTKAKEFLRFIFSEFKKLNSELRAMRRRLPSSRHRSNQSIQGLLSFQMIH